MKLSDRELLRRKEKLIDDSEEIFLADIEKFTTSFFVAVKRVFDRFETADGRIKKSANNTSLVRKLRRTLLSVLKSSTLKSKTQKYLRNFEQVEKYNLELSENLNGRKPKVSLTQEKEDIIESIALGLLNTEVLSKNLITPLRQMMRRHAQRGLKVSEALDEIRTFIKGKEEEGLRIPSEVTKYIRGVAFEGIAQYDGAINQKIADSSSRYDGFQVVGSLIATSAQVCRESVNGVGAFADIVLDADEGIYCMDDRQKYIDRLKQVNKTPSYQRWVATLNPSNLFQSRNHIGCRHQIIPIILSPELKALKASR